MCLEKMEIICTEMQIVELLFVHVYFVVVLYFENSLQDPFITFTGVKVPVTCWNNSLGSNFAVPPVYV